MGLDKMAKLIEVAETMLQDDSSKHQLKRLSCLLCSVQGILGKGPKGHVYHFPPRPSMRLSRSTLSHDSSGDEEEQGGSDATTVSPMPASVQRVSCIEPLRATLLFHHACYKWGDQWSPAELNPLRWSSRCGINDAIASLEAESQQNRQILLRVIGPEVVTTIEEAVSTTRECDSTHVDFKWMWGDLYKHKQINPARWSRWMPAADANINIEGFAGHSRHVRLVAGCKRRFSNVQKAVEFLSGLRQPVAVSDVMQIP